MIVPEVKGLNSFCERVFLISRAAGWWEGSVDSLTPTKLLLIHSEISEATEGHRKGAMDDHLPHRSMLEVELADAVIRIADLVAAHNLDLEGAISEKLEYNKSREDHSLEARESKGGKKY